MTTSRLGLRDWGKWGLAQSLANRVCDHHQGDLRGKWGWGMRLDPFIWRLSQLFEDLGFRCTAYFGPDQLDPLPHRQVIC